MDWPERGVYFFFAAGEPRAGSDQPRLTRVGTRAAAADSGTTLWDRLRTHRGAPQGTYAGGGNHRGSVFRERVGEAIIARDGLSGTYPTWGEGLSAGRERRLAEHDLECRVSEYVRSLPFLYVAVEDPPGPESDRAAIERAVIALASNRDREPIDPREDDWLGRHSPSAAIRESGLWNVAGVDAAYDPGADSAVLDRLERAIAATTPAE